MNYVQLYVNGNGMLPSKSVIFCEIVRMFHFHDFIFYSATNRLVLFVVNCHCTVILQIDEQQHYIEKICRGEEHVLGLPHSIIKKQPVSVLSDR